VKISSRTNRLIRKRSRGRCEICGLPISLGKRHRHHRRPRGAGGADDPVSDSPANVIDAHASCHAHVERNRNASYLAGWLVHQGHDPSQVPFLYAGRGWVLLDEEGEASPTAPPPAVDVAGRLR
jgi:hypothetical protein